MGGAYGLTAKLKNPSPSIHVVMEGSANLIEFTKWLPLFQLGFFKRAHYEKAKLPQYHAIKIPRQERQLFHEEKTGTITKKGWVTSWNGDSDGHVPVST